jgi:hypothetical protein
MSDVEPMGAYLERIAAEHGGDVEAAFDSVKRDFINAPPQLRATWLHGWKQAMDLEYRPSREHAEFIAKKRELDTIHSTLKKAGR